MNCILMPCSLTNDASLKYSPSCRRFDMVCRNSNHKGSCLFFPPRSRLTLAELYRTADTFRLFSAVGTPTSRCPSWPVCLCLTPPLSRQLWDPHHVIVVRPCLYDTTPLSRQLWDPHQTLSIVLRPCLWLTLTMSVADTAPLPAAVGPPPAGAHHGRL